MRPFGPVFIALLIFGLALAQSKPAEAHRQRKDLDTSGIPIPNLTHGQLKVITQYRSSILNLADHQISPDLETRTLQNFINLQYAYCLWGIIPGSLTNEDNPFNECSHAYLAASKALLDKLQRSGNARAEADALASSINMAMLLDASALQICRNGLEPFNTAQIIMPEWANVPFNPLAVILGFFVLAATAGLIAMARNAGKSSV